MHRNKASLSLLATGSFFFLVHQLSLIFPREFNIDKFTIGGVVANVGLIGVVLMAILSGYAAINSPYSNLSVFLRDISEQDIADAQDRLLSTIDQLFEVKKKIAALSSSSSTQRLFGSPISMIFSSSSSNSSQEAEALEMFMTQMHFDLDAMHLDRERFQLARTWRGVYNNLLGYIFSFYCVFKVLSSIYNIILNPQPGKDPVSRILNIIVHSLGIPLDLEFWSAQLSFVFIGVMVVMAVRGLLINLSKVNQVTATTTADLPILLFSHIISFYILSVVIMIRLNIAEQYRSVITSVLGNLEIVFFQRLFDWWFLASCAISGVWHYYHTQAKLV